MDGHIPLAAREDTRRTIAPEDTRRTIAPVVRRSPAHAPCGKRIRTKPPLSTYFLHLLSLLPLLLVAEETESSFPITPHASANIGINSSYISRGKVYENKPIQENEVDLRFDLGDFGYLGGNLWTYSSLSDDFTDKYRQAFPEFDWMPYYGYNWKFAEGWALDSRIRLQWKAYYGGVPEDDPTSFELHFNQSLKSPYATLFYSFRTTFEPEKWNYFVVGLKHTFDVCKYLKLTPRISTDFADATGRRKRFGAKEGGGSYGAGVLSLVAELYAEVPITEWFSIYAAVGQFGILSKEGRDNLDECWQRDITYGKAGVTFSF